jgi:hypothetical protein
LKPFNQNSWNIPNAFWGIGFVEAMLEIVIRENPVLSIERDSIPKLNKFPWGISYYPGAKSAL